MADAHLPCDAARLRRHTAPSLVFQFGTATPLTGGDRRDGWLAEAPGRAAWVVPTALPEGSAEVPARPADLTEIVGTDYTNGRAVRLRLFVSPGIPAPDAPCAG
jgi:hypothetical protein